mmetsp:Transcript_148183/g.269258  ORF Transcript_148183/g.269258 Transcript_148183/m.269258 type:complete len:510 (-) Transcript_148183:11-1540(-)
MNKFAVVLAYMACTVVGRRMRVPPETSHSVPQAEGKGSLASLLLALAPAVTFNAAGPVTLGAARPVLMDGRHGLGQGMPLMSVHEADSEHVGEDWEPAAEEGQFASKAMTSAMAAALALTSYVDFAAAEEAGSFSKVDKSGPIGFIASLIEAGIDTAHTGLENAGIGSTYGISIILFTLLIRTVTLPLIKTQSESAARMQKLQPLMAKINEKYGKPGQEADKNKYIQQLYSSANVNPAAGCAPALVQAPVFICLYRALQNLIAEDKLTDNFLWIPSLEGPVYKAAAGKTGDWFWSIFSGNPQLGWDATLAFLTIPAVLIVTQTISGKIMSPANPNAQQDDTAKFIQSALPFVLAFFSLNVPAGLGLYWIANNVITTTFTVLVRAGMKEEKYPKEVIRLMRKFDPDNALSLSKLTGQRSTRKGFKAKKQRSTINVKVPAQTSAAAQTGEMQAGSMAATALAERPADGEFAPAEQVDIDAAVARAAASPKAGGRKKGKKGGKGNRKKRGKR